MSGKKKAYYNNPKPDDRDPQVCDNILKPRVFVLKSTILRKKLRPQNRYEGNRE